MSNEKIRDFQTDVCIPTVPVAEERFCPTCIPNPNAFVDDWTFSDGVPFLNEQNCEYQVSVIINEEGDFFRPKEIREAANKGIPFNIVLQSFVLPGIRLMLRYFDKMETDDVVCAFPANQPSTGTERGVGDTVTEIATAAAYGGLIGGPAGAIIGGALAVADAAQDMEPNWAETREDQIAKQSTRCRTIYQQMADGRLNEEFHEDVTKKIEVPTGLPDGSTFEVTMVDPVGLLKYQSEDNPIGNPQALELFARPVDYHFGQTPGEPMKVLISIPAFILDAVAQNPDPDIFDFSGVEEVILKGPKIYPAIKRLSEAFRVYGNYQAYWWQTERATLYQKKMLPDGTFVSTSTGEEGAAFTESSLTSLNPWAYEENLQRGYAERPDGTSGYDLVGDPGIFYIIQYRQAVVNFYNALESLLEKNDVRLTRLPDLFGDRAEEVKIVFDPVEEPDPSEEATSDSPTGHYTIKAVFAKYNSCGWQKMKTGFSKFKEHPAVKNQTVMGYIVNLAEIDNELQGAQSPGWLDFIVKHTYPPLDIRYESESVDPAGTQNPIGCIIDSAGGPEALRDFIFDSVMSLGDAVAYQFNKNACKLLADPTARPTEAKFADWRKGQEKRNLEKINAHYKEEQRTLRVEGTRIREAEYKDEAKRQADLTKNADELSASQRSLEAAKNHPYRSAAIDAALQEFDLDSSLIGTFIDEAGLRTMGMEGDIFTDFKGLVGDEDNKSKFNLLVTNLNRCGLTQLLLKSIQCLMGGVTLEVAYEAIVKAALKSMDGASFEQLFIGLPYDKQLEIEEKIRGIVGDMPPPWEWQPGENNIPKLSDQKAVNLEDNIASNENQIEINKEKIGVNKGKIKEIDDALNEIYNMIDEPTAEEVQTIVKAEKDYKKQKKDLEDKNTALKGQNEKLSTKQDKNEKELKDKYPNFAGYADAEPGSEAAEEVESIREHIERYQTSLKSDPQAKFEQGTAGAALGQIQQEIFDVYIDVMISSLQIDVLLKHIEQFPGSRMIVKAIRSLDCPTQPLIHPPISSFLSTLTFSTCQGDAEGKLSIPAILGFGGISFMNLIRALGQAFYHALENALMNAMVKVIVKILQTLESALCKALELTGRLIGQTLTPGDQGGFMGAVADTFCGDDQTEEEQAETASNLLGSLGVLPSDINGMPKELLMDSHKSVMETISSVATKNDIKSLLVTPPSDQDGNLLRRMANAVSVVNPEYAPIFNNPNNVAQIFAAAGNLLSPLQRQAIRDNLGDPEDDVPVDDSICLTKEQLDAWDEDRKSLFEDAGLPPEIAKDWVDKQNDRAKNDLINACSIAARGITSPLQDTLNQMIDLENAMGDPICNTGGSAISFRSETMDAVEEADASGVFAGLTKEFQRDLVGGGLFFRRNGIVDHILADTRGKPLRSHQFSVRSTFFRPNYANSQIEHDQKFDRMEKMLGSTIADIILSDEAEGIFPETVGLHMRDSLLQQDVSFETDFGFNGSTTYRAIKEKFVNEIDYEYEYVKPAMKKKDLTLSFRDTLGGEGDGKFGYGFDMDYRGFVINNIDDSPQVSTKFNYNIDLNILLSTEISEEEAEELGLESPGTEPIKVPVLKMAVDNPIDSERKDILKNLEIDKSDLSSLNYTYQGLVWWSMISQKWSEFNYQPPKGLLAKTTWNKISKDMFSSVTEMMMAPGGELPVGFKFGYEGESAITFEDLLYVDPEATSDKSTWKYTHEEEDKVLGKSATDNPRVHFLDPDIHGGWYSWPKVYVEPHQYEGMLSVIQLMVPEIDGCQPKTTDFLDYQYLADRVTEVKNKIKIDKRLEFDEDCIAKIPFDLIQTNEVHGYIDASILATIRVYIAEFILKALPTFSSLQFNLDNFDDAVASMIIEEMQRGMSDEGSWFDFTYIKRYSYWLHFLEQVFQAVQRRIKYNEMETNQEIDAIFAQINAAQQKHCYVRQKEFDSLTEHPKRGFDLGRPASVYIEEAAESFMSPEELEIWEREGSKKHDHYFDLQGPDRPEDFDWQIKMGAMIGFYGSEAAESMIRVRPKRKDEFDEDSRFMKFVFRWPRFTRNKANRCTKLWTIHTQAENCKILLKYLVIDELNKYSEILANNLKPRPAITSLSRYYIGASNSIVSGGLQTGKRKTEVPFIQEDEQTGEEIVSYEEGVGNCVDVSSDIFTSNPLDRENAIVPGGSTSEGQFMVERYIRLIDKPEAEAENVPDFIKNRADNLRGVVSIPEFRRFVNENMINNPDFDETQFLLSDLFGDAEILRDMSEKGTGVIGSIGFKFGVRLSYIPPVGFSPPAPSPNLLEKAQQEKAYHLKQAQSGGQNTKYIFPVVVFEKDVLDDKLSEVDWQDENFGEDLKCYIDRMSETAEFKLLFENVFPLRRASSLVAIYTYYGFLASIGEHPTERDPDKREKDIDQDDIWRDGLFPDAKDVCYNIFHGFYESDSWDLDFDWSTSFTFRAFFQDMMPTIFTNIDPSTRWWQRWRIQKSRPFDKNGDMCKGIFGDIFGF